MRIFRYWASAALETTDPSGQPARLVCWRGSNTSLEDARQQAHSAIGSIAMRFQQGGELSRYPYGVRALREEVIQAVKDPSGQEAGLITRNGYGALVLNAAQVMFADIDFPEKPFSLAGGLRRLFDKTPAPDPQAEALQRVSEWARRNPGVGLRVYRTAAGLRCLFTHALYDPTAASTLEILRSLGSDPLYTRLCRDQECFRARLTPKPWRIGVRSLRGAAVGPGIPPRYPRQTPNQEQLFARWLSQYESTAPHYTVCRLLAQLGDPQPHPQAAAIVAAHDRLACTDSNLKLA